jgi:hypothetical protein
MVEGSGSGIWGFGFMVKGCGFRIKGLGFWVQGLGFGGWGLEFGVEGPGFRVQGLGITYLHHAVDLSLLRCLLSLPGFRVCVSGPPGVVHLSRHE